MKIQVCRQCGNKNTVLKHTLKKCNYCGSDNLEPIVETDSSAIAQQSGMGFIKWALFLLLLLALVAGGFWTWQSGFLQNAQQDNGLLPNFMQTVSQTSGDEASPDSAHAKTLVNHDNQTVKQNELQQDQQPIASLPPSPQPVKQLADTSQSGSSVSESKALENAGQQPKTSIPVVAANQSIAVSRAEAKIATQSEQAEKKVATVIAPKSAEANIKPVKPAPTQKAAVQAKPKVVRQAAEKQPNKAPQKTRQKPPVQLASVAKVNKSASVKPVVNSKPTLSPQEINQRRNAMRVLDYGNGIVTDRETKLMWMACSLGQTWNGRGCSGEATEFLWSEAIDESQVATYANYQDWRLPTRQELNSIVSCSQGRAEVALDNRGKEVIKNGKKLNGQCQGNYARPTIDTKVFPDTLSSLYWSYSHSAVNNYSAWGVFFNKGYQLSFNTTNTGYVRLVRTIR